MTETEARRAGLLPPRKVRATTDAAETRHVESTRHARYESNVA